MELQSNALEWSRTTSSVPSSVNIGQQIRQEIIGTVTSFGGSCADGADGSVPFLRKHCEVGPSHWLSLEEAATASNKPPGEQP